MSTNDKQTEPERTAMQEHIKWLKDQIYEVMPVGQKVLLKMAIKNAEELRDTVEKEQWVDAYATGAFHFCELELDDPTIRKEGNDNYNEKYTNHGK